MDKNFEGSSLDVNSDLNDLAQQRMGSGIIAGNWNDKIESSAQVLFGKSGRRCPEERRSDGPRKTTIRWPGGTTPTTATAERSRDDYRDDRRYGRYNTVCIFEEINFRGRYECYDSGDEVADLGRRASWNDHISSIRIFGPTRVTLYRDINFRGDRVTVDRDIADLRRLRMT